MPLPTAPRRARIFVFPPYFGFVAAVLGAILLLGPHPALGLLSLVVLVLGVGLLWRPNEIPSMLFFFGYQWLESSLNLVRAFFSGMTVYEQTTTPGAHETAVALTLTGLLCVVAGLRFFAGPTTIEASVLVRQQVLAVPVRKWITAYLVSMVTSLILLELSRFSGGLSQPLLALASLKWAFFLILTYAVFAETRGYKLVWLAIFGFEFLLSLGGYFSSFRLVFIYAFLGILGAAPRMTSKQVTLLALTATVAVFLGTVWTAIKLDYREYVNQGTRSQTVLVSRSQQVERMVTLSTQLSADDIGVALSSLADRISYTQFFGAAISYVPAIRPHTEGAIAASGITRPFMPRVLFPNKEPIDESEHTNEFTGLGVSGIEQGTQISIGYMGDAYIDFGKLGMMAALFTLGCGLGLFYRRMTQGQHTRGIIGGGIAAVLMVDMSDIGIGGEKLLAGIVIWIVMISIFVYSALPNMRRWLGLVQRTLSPRNR
ncbi:hypothetical protein AAW00_04625 [Aurantiacibacter luteus]|uniref:Uncharacterized protein n=2 Tax=Aurantiacibacter luteus TaxID=1581420 RepID=A0A0G9MY88_9SPHN|nr:hypothetical protein AAW00_04625 [Aurantiacibacter luteus]